MLEPAFEVRATCRLSLQVDRPTPAAFALCRIPQSVALNDALRLIRPFQTSPVPEEYTCQHDRQCSSVLSFR